MALSALSRHRARASSFHLLRSATGVDRPAFSSLRLLPATPSPLAAAPMPPLPRALAGFGIVLDEKEVLAEDAVVYGRGVALVLERRFREFQLVHHLTHPVKVRRRRRVKPLNFSKTLTELLEHFSEFVVVEKEPIEHLAETVVKMRFFGFQDFVEFEVVCDRLAGELGF